MLKLPAAAAEPATLWRAVSRLVRQKFTPSAITQAKAEADRTVRQKGSAAAAAAVAQRAPLKTRTLPPDSPLALPQPQHLQLSEVPLGFEVSDAAIQQAAKVLRLLHVAELRHLQVRTLPLCGRSSERRLPGGLARGPLTTASPATADAGQRADCVRAEHHRRPQDRLAPGQGGPVARHAGAADALFFLFKRPTRALLLSGGREGNASQCHAARRP